MLGYLNLKGTLFCYLFSEKDSSPHTEATVTVPEEMQSESSVGWPPGAPSSDSGALTESLFLLHWNVLLFS